MFGINLPDTVKVAAVVGICSNGRISEDDIIVWRAVNQLEMAFLLSGLHTKHAKARSSSNASGECRYMDEYLSSDGLPDIAV